MHALDVGMIVQILVQADAQEDVAIKLMEVPVSNKVQANKKEQHMYVIVVGPVVVDIVEMVAKDLVLMLVIEIVVQIVLLIVA